MGQSPQAIADTLAAALAQGSAAYGAALAHYWADEAIRVTHQPPMPQDRPMDRQAMLDERAIIQTAFHALMPDFRYEHISSHVVGTTIFLFCVQSGTLADGQKIASPLCSQFIVGDGRFREIVLTIDPLANEPLTKAFAARAAATPSASPQDQGR